jgi:phosphohistidine phosphatase SixA
MSTLLYLLRHAKSSWKHAELSDHDQPLAARGRRAADAIARHMREQAIAPELVLCSTARRARETAERIQPRSVRRRSATSPRCTAPARQRCSSACATCRARSCPYY